MGSQANKHQNNSSSTLLLYAEYACPVWERSTHVRELDPALNEACRSITRSLRPTSVDNVYLLAGIAASGVRWATTSRQE